MIHVGDITKLSGYTLPPVDVITGGSPCQDLSIAGVRKGLDGERSGLFLEQIRIVKELREADKQRGRTNQFVRPRFMVWENVCGAFSSNKGRDFQRVLTECVRIAEPDAPDIPCPKKWPLADAYFGDGWSIAYRVFDAQFWGVPQRRRRICLIADFGGRAAAEILFVRESLSGDTAAGGTPGKETATGTGGGAYPSIARSLTARYDGSPCIDRGPNIVAQGFGETGIGYWASGIQTLRVSGDRPGSPTNVVVLPICDKATRYQGGGVARNCDGAGNGLGVGHNGDSCFTLTSADRHAVFAVHQNQCGEVRLGDVANTLSTNGNASGRNAPLCYDARGNGDGKIVNTLTGDHGNRVTDYTPIVLGGELGGATSRNQVLRVLQEAYGTEAVFQWGVRVLDILQSEEILRQGVYESGIPGKAEHGNALVNGALPRPEFASEWLLRDLRERKECGCTSQGWQSTKQQYEQFAETLPELPYERTQNAQSLFDMWKAGKRLGLLRKALSEIQEIRQSVCCESESAQQYSVVRRLTPLEAERLQGFPDGYTDIGDWTDDNGKIHKTSDSARYRALGNSIALPPWKWVLKRIAAQYERGATLGSLFDGIGGFPYLWEQFNGKGSAVWASEIEPFCIAVTKRRLG